MFTEDMNVFFDAAVFAVTASFTPSGGGAVQSAAVIFDAITADVLDGDSLSDEFTITYPASDLLGVRAGDYGTIEGVSYRVREIMLTADGKLKMARLSKV